MAGELSYSFKDLYPNATGIDTSTLATPEVSDQVALNEDISNAEKSSPTEAKRKNIFIALGVIVALIVFFGGK